MYSICIFKERNIQFMSKPKAKPKQNDTSSLTPKPTAKPNVGIGTTPTTQSYNSQSKK